MTAAAPGACIFEPCVATWRHWHGGFPGGYDDPADPTGPPIDFVGDEPDEGVRDYNGAPLSLDTHSRSGAEPSGVTPVRAADGPGATSSDGGSPETERAMASASPERITPSGGSPAERLHPCPIPPDAQVNGSAGPSRGEPPVRITGS